MPAVVVFCIALGIALITSKEKQEVFKLFDVLADAVMRVIKFVVKLTPFGVFAMTASAAGTMGFEELGRLQGYFILYTVAVLILGFGVLPGLIASLTPFKYRDVISIAWSAMVLSFAAAKVLVALPLIIESIKELFEKYEIQGPEGRYGGRDAGADLLSVPEHRQTAEPVLRPICRLVHWLPAGVRRLSGLSDQWPAQLLRQRGGGHAFSAGPDAPAGGHVPDLPAHRRLLRPHERRPRRDGHVHLCGLGGLCVQRHDADPVAPRHPDPGGVGHRISSSPSSEFASI